MVRHPNLDWAVVEQFLRNNPKAIQTLRLMVIFCDCSQESPALRRSLCYDNEALSLRKKNPPAGSAMAQASQMGLELLTECLYRQLQETGEYDTKTSSWIATPSPIRSSLRHRIYIPQWRRLLLFRTWLERIFLFQGLVLLPDAGNSSNSYIIMTQRGRFVLRHFSLIGLILIENYCRMI